MKKYIYLCICLFFVLNYSCFGQTDLSQSDILTTTDTLQKFKSVDNCWDLSVIPFNQLDEIWADEPMRTCESETYTIGEKGCAMTCMAMLLHANGEKVTPLLLNDFLRKNNFQGYQNCIDILWCVAAQYPIDPPCGSYTPTFIGMENFDLYTIKTNLENHDPVIMHLVSKGHFIIITGYKNAGLFFDDFTVIDPANGVERELSYYSDYCLGNLQCLRTFDDVNAPCIPEVPPDHCENCLFEPELGERGEDCGGTCPPCEDNQYQKIYTSSIDLQDENIATHRIIIEPAGDLSINGEKKFLCNEEITIKNDANISYGSNVSFSISGNRNNLTRDCDDWCIFTPNCTSGEYFVRLTNIHQIDFDLYSVGGTKQREYHNTNWRDGKILLFDMTGLSDGVYYYVAHFYPCNNYMGELRTGTITLLSEKKNISFDESQLTDSVKQSLNSSFPIVIFPNPNKGFFTIEMNQVTREPISIAIYNLLGLSVYQNFLTSMNSSIDISNLPTGNYILKIYHSQGTYSRLIMKN